MKTKLLPHYDVFMHLAFSCKAVSSSIFRYPRRSMHAIKSARRLIENDLTSTNAKILSSWVLAVQAEENCNVARLYELDIESFDSALAILKEWRLDRYYAGKAKLFDMALQVRELQTN